MNELTTPITATAPVPQPAVPQERVAELDKIGRWCESLSRTSIGQFERAFYLASAVRRLRSLITDQMIADVMCLQGSPLGFLTDRDQQGGYPIEVVKEVAIEATLRGLRLVGNEINIIAGRCYPTKQGLVRLVRSWPGLTDLRLDLRAPKIEQDWALVPCGATWLLDGRPQSIDCTGDRAIPVRVNRGMIVDAILGKASRKLLARIYEQLCGEQSLVDDDIDLEQGPVSIETDQRPETIPSQLQGYLEEIERAIDRMHVGQIVKAAAVDPRLSREDRDAVIAAANRRCQSMRQQRPASNAGGQLFDTQCSATEAGL